ncbi:MAG: hypothetical protein PHQ81_09090 [Methanofollis sp.]|nr:hypothetical protein [Methanofollis sp.]
MASSRNLLLFPFLKRAMDDGEEILAFPYHRAGDECRPHHQEHDENVKAE